MKKQLISFHGKQSIKDKYIARVKAHAEDDEIIKGKYWEDGKGCAVGCTIEGNEHKRYETELGIPESIAYLEDGIFEGLSNEEAMKFPLEFIEAIPVGADLSKVTIQFKIWLLMDKKHGVIQYADAQTKKVIKKIVALQKRELLGEAVDYSDVWSDTGYVAGSSARSTARASAWYATRASVDSTMLAGWSVARSAAWSAAESVTMSSAESAWSTVWSDAEYVAESAMWSANSAQKDKLLQLLRDAPVIN